MNFTKEEADLIVEQNDAFKKKEDTINGTKIVQYTYTLPSYGDFAQPLKGSPAVNAFEMRGISFIEQPDGSWKRNLMLHKFYNLNQTTGYFQKDLKNTTVVNAFNKEDGSLIRFLRLPDGTITAKSKFSLYGHQVDLANKYLKNKSFLNFINETIDNDIAAIFELTGPNNKVVLQYNEESLTLLQMRDEKTGKYLSVHDNDIVTKHNIKTVPVLKIGNHIDDFAKASETAKDMEGWVVLLSNEMLVKVKTKWYLNLHGLMLSVEGQEHHVIKIVLNEDVDDLLSLSELEEDTKEYVRKIEEVISKLVTSTVREIVSVLKEGNKLDRKEFALKFSSLDNFGLMMRAKAQNLQESDIFKLIKEGIIKETKTAEKAKYFLKRKGIKIKEKPIRSR